MISAIGAGILVICIAVFIFGMRTHDERTVGGLWHQRRYCDKCKTHWSRYDPHTICPHCANTDSISIRLVPARYEWTEHLISLLGFKPQWERGSSLEAELVIYEDGRIPKDPAE